MTQAQWTIIGIAALIALIVWYGMNKHLNQTLIQFFKDAMPSTPATENATPVPGTKKGGSSG